MELEAPRRAGPGPGGTARGSGWVLTWFSSPRPGALPEVGVRWGEALATAASRAGVSAGSAHTKLCDLGQWPHLPEPQFSHLLTGGKKKISPHRIAVRINEKSMQN